MSNRSSDWNQEIIDEFRAHGGNVSSRGFGKSLVLLHHIGARSGVERVCPVMGIRTDPDTWLVAASKAGAPENPAWYHNLLAHPDVVIETPDDGTVPVRARSLPICCVEGEAKRLPMACSVLPSARIDGAWHIQCAPCGKLIAVRTVGGVNRQGRRKLVRIDDCDLQDAGRTA